MKKLFCLLIAFAFLTGCNKVVEEVELSYDRPVGIVEIDYDSLQEKLETPTDFILYIGRPDCGDCKLFYPCLEQFIQNHEGSGIYYLNIKSFRDNANKEDATKEEKEFYENLKENLGFAWTPSLIRYQDGQKAECFEFLDASFQRQEGNIEENPQFKQSVAEFESWMERNLKIDE